MSQLRTIDVNTMLLQEKRLQGRGRIVSWAAWVYVAILLLYGVILLWWGDSWWPAMLLLYGPRWPMALPLLTLIPLAWKYKRKTLIPITIALALLLFPITQLNIPFHALLHSVPAETARLRIVSFNANMGKINMTAWNEFLLQTEPDIVVCQEWPLGSVRPQVWATGWFIQEHIGNLLVVSRWPIVKTQLLREDELKIRGYAGWYDLNTPWGSLSLADIHLPTPRGEGELEDALHGKWKKFSELDQLSARRLTASRDVHHWLSNYPLPMIIAGDYNLPCDSSIYREVWSTYHDAFTQAGWGWGYTKWTSWYGLRIDHILLEKPWSCSRCRVGPSVGSDHLPLIAELVFTGGN